MSGSDVTCWTVIRAAAKGDGEARAEFARRYEPIVRAFLAARWARSPLTGEIDDAAQEVFVDFLREGGALTRVDPGRAGGFRAFLSGVVRNVARRVEERRARAERQPGSSLDLASLPDDAEGPSRAFDRAYARSLLRQAARLMARRARDEDAARRVKLLTLRFSDDLPIREIARRWAATPDRLHQEYARARKEFREVLREVVAEHHPGSPREVEEECARLVELFA